MGLLKWLWQRFLTKPANMGGLGMLLVWGGAAAGAVMHAPTVTRTSHEVELAGGALLGSAIVIGALQYLKRLMPRGTTTAAALVVYVAAYGFFVFVPPVLVALVTSGASWSAMVTAMTGRGGHGLVADVLGGARFACQLICLFLLVGVPAVLRRWLSWHTASEHAKSLMPSWLAAAATVLTWLYIVLLHFGGGALAHAALGLITVAGIGAAALLAPLYQFIARSCWEYGSLTLFDPRMARGSQRRRQRDPALTRCHCVLADRSARSRSVRPGSQRRRGLTSADGRVAMLASAHSDGKLHGYGRTLSLPAVAVDPRLPLPSWSSRLACHGHRWLARPTAGRFTRLSPCGQRSSRHWSSPKPTPESAAGCGAATE
jgi:hypothetical protein